MRTRNVKGFPLERWPCIVQVLNGSTTDSTQSTARFSTSETFVWGTQRPLDDGACREGSGAMP